MSENKIEKVEELISDIIGENKKVVDTKVSRLTAPGQNFLSLVLKVDYVVENEETHIQEEIHGVAKVIPPEGKIRSMFEGNYKSETAFYESIVPSLQTFQIEQGVDQVIDFFPKLIKARPNLDGMSDKVDQHAVILLENIAVLGYKNVDRLVSFDLETTELILKDLAKFHGVSLALKQLHPEVYKEKISSHFIAFPGPPPEKDGSNDMPRPDLEIIDFLEEREEFSDYMPIIKPKLKFRGNIDNEPEGLFSTISHGDLWVNNIMTYFENSKPIKNKFVDFQMYNDNSVAKDLLFFLWTSVQLPILEEHFDDLVEFYYNELIETLKQHKCETKLFSFEKFLEDIPRIAQSEFGHIMIMTLFVVFGKKREDGAAVNPMEFLNRENTTPEGRQKILYIAREFIKRRWLD